MIFLRRILQLTSVLGLMAFLSPAAVTGKKSKQLSNDQKTQVEALIDASIKSALDKFQRQRGECMSNDEWWDSVFSDCRSCDTCNSSTDECYLQCKAYLIKNELLQTMESEDEKLSTTMDWNAQEIWIAIAVLVVMIVFLSALVIFLLCSRRKQAGVIKANKRLLSDKIDNNKKEFDEYVQRLNKLPPVGDNVGVQEVTPKEGSECDRLIENDSGLSGSDQSLPPQYHGNLTSPV